jgi:hypothetical protein
MCGRGQSVRAKCFSISCMAVKCLIYYFFFEKCITRLLLQSQLFPMHLGVANCTKQWKLTLSLGSCNLFKSVAYLACEIV